MLSQAYFNIKKTNHYFYFFLLLFLLERIYSFFSFSIVYTDSDQGLMWQTAIDMSQGIFRSPCFYGQAYNPNLEPLLAAPFIACGISAPVALAFITTIMAIVPYLVFSVLLLKKQGVYAATIPLLTALLLSPEYSMFTSLSRGFVTGIFLFSIALWLLSQKSSVLHFIGALLLGLSLYANLNTVMMFPLLLPFATLYGSLDLKKTMLLLCGFAIGISSLLFNHLFYAAHPHYIVHASPQLGISLNNFITVISKLDNYFDFISPLLWRFGYLSLLFLPWLAIKFYQKKQKQESYFVWGLFLFLLFSFSVSKVSDGTNSIFLSGSRMFIAYPFLMSLLALLSLKLMTEQGRQKFYRLLGIGAACCFVIKVLTFNYFVNNAVSGKNSVVSVSSLKHLKNRCDSIAALSDKTALIVTESDGPAQLISYACPCLAPNFPPTLQSSYERRTWLRDSLSKQVFSPVLVQLKSTQHYKLPSEKIKVLRSFPTHSMVLIETPLSTAQLLKEIQNKE